jgi:uncharacterized protein
MHVEPAPMTPTSDTPSLPIAERLPVLDILRGFALMGILIMNMPGFTNSFFAEADGSHLWSSPIDQFAEQAREALFSGKFNSMFSLLFGIGFTIQYARMQQRDPTGATGVYLRRLFALLAFGVIHAWIFWPGDVLHTYAILGFLLVLGLRRVSDRGIVAILIGCLFYPAVNGVLRLFVYTPEVVAERVRLAQAFEASNNAAFGQGGFLDMVRENVRMMNHFYFDWLNLWGTVGWWVMLGTTLLLGVLAGRRRWAQRIPELMPQIRRLTWWALAIGLGCGVAFTVIFELNREPGPSPIKLLGNVCYNLSRPALMIFYVLVIVRIAQSATGQRWLKPWSMAGRMPLTNYLMQTAICLTLFQHWGFGLWLKVGPALGLVLALAIFFVIQVPWSTWWLARHERGPMEALWARLTYGSARSAPAAVTPATPAGQG